MGASCGLGEEVLEVGVCIYEFRVYGVRHSYDQRSSPKQTRVSNWILRRVYVNPYTLCTYALYGYGAVSESISLTSCV